MGTDFEAQFPQYLSDKIHYISTMSAQELFGVLVTLIIGLVIISVLFGWNTDMLISLAPELVLFSFFISMVVAFAQAL